ncbi:hypothetical protein WUBG_12442 [Wuchereria bancrofti]|uniref:Uncharacterized protein n=1 Tax=Wuchereria bancrofti TaxID=6293 RepID=J9AQM4_WUCBA|nr:hypothetical protein WUBG_12442 [Wuchereria bancrofti]
MPYRKKSDIPSVDDGLEGHRLEAENNKLKCDKDECFTATIASFTKNIKSH